MKEFFKTGILYDVIAVFSAIAIIVFFAFILAKKNISEPIFIHEKVLLNPPEPVHNVRPVDENDHIWGDINAPVKIIEYSDLECPYCKTHHFNMVQIVNEYRGEIAWVFRHHPLDHRFTKSRREAEASECVAALGGNVAFWRFIDEIYTVTPSNDGLDLSLLPELAGKVGIDTEQFTQCFNKRTYAEKVEADFQNARQSGLSFTPSMIIVWPDGEKKSLIIGARSYEILTATLNIILDKDGVPPQLPRDNNDAFSR